VYDPEVAESKGLSVERLKKIFTAEPDEAQASRVGKRRFLKSEDKYSLQWVEPSSDLYTLPEDPTDYELRCYLENLIEARLTEGWQRSFDSFRLYAPVDIAMDSTPYNKTNFPLIMLGQGHINLDVCDRQLAQASPELHKKIISRDEHGKPFKVNWPRFFEVSYNILHSLVSRRVASVSTPIATRFPFLRYDPAGTAQTSKLRADLVTQYVEKMSEAFGYKHDIIQSVRDCSCYAHQIEFCRSSWTKETRPQYVKPVSDGVDGLGPEDSDYVIEDKVTREGVEFIAPHPSRTFWDVAYPLAKLNVDCGPTYVGYWDVVRYRDIRENMELWNREAVELNPSAYEFLASNDAYFRVYYPDTIVFPTKDNLGSSYSMGNDRLANVGYYAQLNDDVPCTKSEMFVKINPKKFGICKYDADVWLRLMVGGTRTVMYAEPMPSRPAVVYHYNENDGRMYSTSFAHAVMPYQDQISNLLSQLLEIQVQGLTKIIELNIDGMAEGDIKIFEDSVKNRNYYAASSILVKYSAESLKDMGVDARLVQRVRAVELQTGEKTGEIFRSITQLLAFCERLLFFSPQELGQVAPREITATEANIVNNTTLGVRDFHTLGIEEGLAAKKIILYEAAMAFGSNEVKLSVQDRYTVKTIEEAGFVVVETDGDPTTTEFKPLDSGRFTVTGDKTQLQAEYVFTTRDGIERPSSQANAQNMLQMLQIISQGPMAQLMPKDKILELMNEIGRNLGAGFDLRVALPPGQDGAQPLGGDPQQQMQEVMKQVGGAIQQLTQKQAQSDSTIGELKSNLTMLTQMLAAKGGPALPPGPPTRPGQVAPDIPPGAGAPTLDAMPVG
jgi:hypothetical protein